MVVPSDVSTLPDPEAEKSSYKDELKKLKEQLFDLQNVFYADSRFSLLIVLQGMDTAGKDSTIRHVMNSMNPMGVHVKAFKKSTEDELQYDFLWRIYKEFPPKGMIKVFNRSHYEDVLVPYSMSLLPKERLDYRCDHINRIESHLERNNTRILKFFLHISKEEQESRLRDRMNDPKKQWKYHPSDIQSHNNWDQHARAYRYIFKRCNAIPWNIIPADKKWYRNVLDTRTQAQKRKAGTREPGCRADQ